MFYQPATGSLYMLAMIIKGTSLVYTIYKYQIIQPIQPRKKDVDDSN